MRCGGLNQQNSVYTECLVYVQTKSEIKDNNSAPAPPQSEYLRDDHRASAGVGENFCEQGVAHCAAQDVSAVHTAP